MKSGDASLAEQFAQWPTADAVCQVFKGPVCRPDKCTATPHSGTLQPAFLPASAAAGVIPQLPSWRLQLRLLSFQAYPLPLGTCLRLCMQERCVRFHPYRIPMTCHARRACQTQGLHSSDSTHEQIQWQVEVPQWGHARRCHA